jgi:hypothetical protein
LLLIRKMIIIKYVKVRSGSSLSSGWEISLREAPAAEDMVGDGFRLTVSCPQRGEGMKKILIALIVVIMWLPLTVNAQQWVEPYTKSDGTMVEGHWVTPQDRWSDEFSRPGTINPYTGNFNRYGRDNLRSSDRYSAPATQSPMVVPGSSAPNPYAIPGSSAPNPYAIPGSSSALKAANPYEYPGSSSITQRTAGPLR